MKSFKELSENLKEDLGLGKVHLPSNQQVMAINRKLKADAPEVLKDYRKLLKAIDKSAVTGQEIVYIRDEPSAAYRKKTGFGDAHRVVMRKRTNNPLGKEVVYHSGSSETTYNTVLAFKEEYVHEGTSASDRGEPQTPHTKKQYDALSPKDKKLVDARVKAARKQSMSRNPSESPRNYKKHKPKTRRGGVSKYGRGQTGPLPKNEEVNEMLNDIIESKRMERLLKQLGFQLDKPGPRNPTDADINAMDSFLAGAALKGWTKNPDGSQGYPFGHPFQSPKRKVKKLMNKFFKNHGMTGPGMIEIIKTDATPKEKAELKQLTTQLGNGTPREKELLGKISTIMKESVNEGGMGRMKDPHTIRYVDPKQKDTTNISVVDGEREAKKFLAKVKKKGMSGTIKKGSEQPGSIQTVKYNQSTDQLNKASRYDTLTGKRR